MGIITHDIMLNIANVNMSLHIYDSTLMDHLHWQKLAR
jgi:hypothetical protein